MNELNNLPDAGPLDGTELVPVLQNGIWCKAPLYLVIDLPAPTITAAPGSFTATAIDDTQIDLTWTGIGDYVLQSCRGNDGAWVTIYEGTTASFSDTGLYGDETYYYRVNDTDTGEFTSAWSLTNETTPTPP